MTQFIRRDVYEKAITNQERMRTEYIHRSKGEKAIFKIGDWVLYWIPDSKEPSRKFQNYWSGPYQVVKIYTDSMYGISNGQGV